MKCSNKCRYYINQNWSCGKNCIRNLKGKRYVYKKSVDMFKIRKTKEEVK